MIPFIALAGTVALFAIAALVIWAFRDWQYDRDLTRELEQLRAEQVARSTARHPSTRHPDATAGPRKIRACDLRPGHRLYPSYRMVKDRPWPMPDGTYRVVVADIDGRLDLVVVEGKAWESVEVFP